MGSDNLLRIYHNLPSPARSFVASLRGYLLNYYRYSAETEKQVAQALEREFWAPEMLEEWSQKRLSRILDRASTRVPYYRRQWDSAKPCAETDRHDLANWKVLRKDAVRNDKYAFLADDVNPRRLFLEHTSGTTGTPVEFWIDRAGLQAWYSLAEARWRRWYSVSRRDRWAIIGGQQVVPFDKQTPPYWVWNAGLNQLYMSALHIRPDFLRHYLDAVRRYKIVYLYGYSSSLYWLALAALENNVTLELKVVLTNAEPLYEFQREVMVKAFNCPVRETYGLCEMVCAMSECEFGSLHLWPEAGVVEILDDDDKPVKPGESGRLVCTGLLNEAMPLVRYEVMDQARLASPDFRCPCGRGLPVVDKVLGRLDDTIVTKDGRKLALLDIIFGSHLHIKEAQLIQESLDLIRVRVVPAEGWDGADEEEIKSALGQRAPGTAIRVEVVDQIERTFAGKLRVMISKINS